MPEDFEKRRERSVDKGRDPVERARFFSHDDFAYITATAGIVDIARGGTRWMMLRSNVNNRLIGFPKKIPRSFGIGPPREEVCPIKNL